MLRVAMLVLFYTFGSSTSLTEVPRIPKAVRTYDFQIMVNTFHVPETLALTTEPSATS